MKFNNKTLLMLGTNVMSYETVQYARKNGAYVIVADNLPPERSVAKMIADESVLISTADTEELIRFCKERSVDGVFAGISEFNLFQAMTISEALGLRFYCTHSQWNLIQRKDQFRNLCHEYRVPCPDTYFWGTKNELSNISLDKFRYPLIVKPVDCAASDGVAICESETEAIEAINKAFQISPAERAIIEEYIHGYEFTAHYTICNGRATLTCIDNRYPVEVNAKTVPTIPIARVFPSLFIDKYMDCVNAQMIRLCEGIGLQYAVVFIQGLYRKTSDSFHIFEAGLRSAAEAPCRFLETITGQNYYFMLLDSILADKVSYDIKNECPDLNGLCCGVVSFASSGGVVGQIAGLEETVSAVPDILEYESRYPVGTNVPSGSSLRQLMIRFVLCCSNRKELADQIKFINSNVTATDVNGNDMFIKMKPERVFDIE